MAEMWLTTRALQRFRCIAERCEDSCCRGWAIVLDRGDVERLVQLGRRSDAAGFDITSRIEHSDALGGSVKSTMKQDAEGGCVMLDGGAHCSLQARFGESALPRVCSMHPRSLRKTPAGRHEMVGSMSCPEYARLLLLSEDGAEPVEFDRRQCPRPESPEDLGQGHSGAYLAAFDEVRDALLEVYRDGPDSLDQALSNLAELAIRLRARVHRDSSDIPKAALSRAVERVRAPARVPEKTRLAARELEHCLRFLLRLGAGSNGTGRLHGLLKEVHRHFPALISADDAPINAETLSRCLQGLGQRYLGRLDTLCMRMVGQLLFAGSQLGFRDLGEFVRQLLVEVLALRMLVLLLHHGRACEDEPESFERFDALVVEVFSAWSRALQFNPSFATAVGELCAVLGLCSPAGTRALAGTAAALRVEPSLSAGERAA